MHILPSEWIKRSLPFTERLLETLGRPQDRLPPVIHVAGTNGKGSTIAFLRAIAEAAGLKVHVLISPHLVHFPERIRLAGRLIENASLVEVLGRAGFTDPNTPAAYYQIAAAAFLAFSETPADLCLVETFVGGRFDPTNVVHPAVSVITPIGFDHQEYLGSTLGEIAGVKAGIIKPGRPVVSAHQEPEAAAVIAAEAEVQGSPLAMAGRDFDAFSQGGRLMVRMGERCYDLPPPSLIGTHQFANAGVAVAAALTLNDPRIDEEALARGVASAVWPGRMQRLTRGPLGAKAEARGAELWLDAGHNAHGAAALVETLKAFDEGRPRPTTLIVSFLKGKDLGAVFRTLKSLNLRMIVTASVRERHHSPEDLANAAMGEGVQVECRKTVEEALDLALDVEGPPPRVLIWGSIYQVGQVLSLSKETWPV